MKPTLFVAYSTGTDPYENLALEELLLQQCAPNTVTLYLWQNAHTVVIGRNQNPWTECRLSLLEEEGGHLARRLSGGGAVYHDLGNLNFTFICREEDFDLQKQLSVIQRACSFAGIEASFSGRNDLLAEGKKFSGNAFYHSKGLAYHHGTLLIQSDLSKLQRYLSPPKAKLEAKGIASVRSRVINLSDLSPSLTCEAMQQLMVQAFSDIYGSSVAPCVMPDPLSIRQLREKYAGAQWLLGQPFPFTCSMEGQFPWGHLQLQLSVSCGIIDALQVFTDAMDADLPEKLKTALVGCLFQSDSMMQAIADLEYGNELCAFLQEQL